MGKRLYFAYGSNMNLDQMEFRCPEARVTGTVRLEDFRLAFCGNASGCGVATILPEKGSHVDGVLWEITSECERNLDRYEGYPNLYDKEMVCVKDKAGMEMEVMVYTINSPYKERPSSPSRLYLNGIVEGCRQNGIRLGNIREAVKRAREEEKTGKQAAGNRKKYRER